MGFRNFGASLTKAGAPTSGVLQVETAVVVGTITTAGNVEVIVTAAGMTGSPKTINVAVALDDDASAVAGKIRAALAADTEVSAMFSVSGSGANVVLTAIKSAANDAILNIAVDNGTAAGLTPDATSNNTTSGVRGDFRGAGQGSALIDTANSNLYENSGNDNQPVWTLL